MDAMHRKEDLREELMQYYYEHGPLGVPCIKHPLVFSVMHRPELNAIMNEHYAHKSKALAEAKRDDNWSKAIALYERPFRIDAFRGLMESMDDETYWSLLSELWTDSENIWEQEDQWYELLRASRGKKYFLMSEDEHQAFAQLPSIVTLYRGYTRDDRQLGLSWTLNRKTAEWFATRFHVDPAVRLESARVIKGTVDRGQILAHFKGRSEDEIVVAGKWVSKQQVYSVS